MADEERKVEGRGRDFDPGMTGVEEVEEENPGLGVVEVEASGEGVEI